MERISLRLALSGVAGAALACGALADSPAVTGTGVGARASALGNSFVALADDYTAAYWNPAGLAFSRSREVQVATEAAFSSAGTGFDGDTTQVRRQRVRLSHAGWLRSLPVSRGGIAFAIGYTRPWLLDNVYRFRGTDTYRGEQPMYGSYYLGIDPATGDTLNNTVSRGDWLRYDLADARIHGNIGLLGAAVGWQVAPGLGIGAGVSLLTGAENQYFKWRTKNRNGWFEAHEESMERDYSGLDIRGGLMFIPVEPVRIGIRVEAPQIVKVKQVYAFRDSIYPDNSPQPVTDERRLRGPFRAAAGVALRLPALTITTEGTVRAPQTDATEGTPRAFWKGGAGVGLEAPVPRTPLLLRAGYRWQQPDLNPYQPESIDRLWPDEPAMESRLDCHTVSWGPAFLVRGALALELSHSASLWRQTVTSPDWDKAIAEDHKLHRINFAFAVRY